MKVSRGEERNK